MDTLPSSKSIIHSRTEPQYFQNYRDNQRTVAIKMRTKFRSFQRPRFPFFSYVNRFRCHCTCFRSRTNHFTVLYKITTDHYNHDYNFLCISRICIFIVTTIFFFSFLINPTVISG